MTRQPLLLAVLVGCGLAWGSTQSLGKIAVSTGYRPFGLLFWQFVLGVAVMGLFMALRRTPLVVTRRSLGFALVVALLGSVLPGITFWTSVERLPAGIMSLLISTVPIMAFLIALLLGQDRFSGLRGLGLLCGLGGVALIALPEASLPEPGQVAFLPLAMMGPLLYAMETNFVQRVGMGAMDPFQAMALVSGLGALIVLPMTLASGQWIDPLVPWGAAEWAFLASSMVHVLTYAAYVWLAAQAGSTFASQCSYIVTASGLVWASTLLGESFSPFIWAALILMLAGLALVTPRDSSAARS
jgi:drug/metabolite transporter (DMT)-like permease